MATVVAIIAASALLIGIVAVIVLTERSHRHATLVEDAPLADARRRLETLANELVQASDDPIFKFVDRRRNAHSRRGDPDWNFISDVLNQQRSKLTDRLLIETTNLAAQLEQYVSQAPRRRGNLSAWSVTAGVVTAIGAVVTIIAGTIAILQALHKL